MKPISAKMLSILRAKITPVYPNHKKPSYWYIYGTPVEIIVLIDEYRVQHDYGYMEYLRESIKEGDMHSRYFYFSCSSTILDGTNSMEEVINDVQ